MKKALKWFSRSLAVLLTVLLMAEALPLHGFALEQGKEKIFRQKDFAPISGELPVSSTPQGDEPIADQEEGQSLIVGEDIGLRTEDTKYFRCEDGRYLVATYNAPVHYADSKGNWRDIDNTLKAVNGSFETRDSADELSIPKDITKDKLEIGDKKHTLAFGVKETAALTVSDRKAHDARIVAEAPVASVDSSASLQEAAFTAAEKTLDAKDKSALSSSAEESVEAQNAEIMSLKNLSSAVAC